MKERKKLVDKLLVQCKKPITFENLKQLLFIDNSSLIEIINYSLEHRFISKIPNEEKSYLITQHGKEILSKGGLEKIEKDKESEDLKRMEFYEAGKRSSYISLVSSLIAFLSLCIVFAQTCKTTEPKVNEYEFKIYLNNIVKDSLMIDSLSF